MEGGGVLVCCLQLSSEHVTTHPIVPFFIEQFSRPPSLTPFSHGLCVLFALFSRRGAL